MVRSLRGARACRQAFRDQATRSRPKAVNSLLPWAMACSRVSTSSNITVGLFSALASMSGKTRLASADKVGSLKAGCGSLA